MGVLTGWLTPAVRLSLMQTHLIEDELGGSALHLGVRAAPAKARRGPAAVSACAVRGAMPVASPLNHVYISNSWKDWLE